MMNDLGVDPYEWFDNPLDKMPIAKDEPVKYNNKYAPPEKTDKARQRRRRGK